MKLKIQKPDGTIIEAEGSAEDIAAIVRGIEAHEKAQQTYPQGYDPLPQPHFPMPMYPAPQPKDWKIDWYYDPARLPRFE